MPGPTALVVPHNWSQPLVERYAWLTDVQTAHDGTETRLPLREAPRRTVRHRVARWGREARRLDADAWGWRGAADLDVPIWQDAQELAAALPSASGSIPCTTSGRDFRVGGLAVLTDGAVHEVVTIATVGESSLTLSADTTQDWPAGTRLAPMRAGQIVGVSRRYLTAGVVEGDVVVELTALGDHVTPAGSGSTYRSRPLDTRRPDWADGHDAALDRVVEHVDSDTGIWVRRDVLGRPVAARTLDYLLFGRSAVRSMLAWLHYLGGRATGFWQPTWQQDVELAAAVEADDTVITIRSDPGAYGDRYDLRQGRRDLALWHKPTQTLHCRRIVSSEDIELTLDEGLPVAGAPSDWCVSWLEYVRLDADEIEVAYVTAEVARVQLAVREIVVEENAEAHGSALVTEMGDWIVTETGDVLVWE